MNSSYVIYWKSQVKGRSGRGSKQFSRAEAEALAAELNLEYPQIEHQAIRADAIPVSASAQELLSAA
jgi:hypothetical protein